MSDWSETEVWETLPAEEIRPGDRVSGPGGWYRVDAAHEPDPEQGERRQLGLSIDLGVWEQEEFIVIRGEGHGS